MTKRSYEEEGGGFAFFQIGEPPLEEPLLEEAGKKVIDQQQNLKLASILN